MKQFLEGLPSVTLCPHSHIKFLEGLTKRNAGRFVFGKASASSPSQYSLSFRGDLSQAVPIALPNSERRQFSFKLESSQDCFALRLPLARCGLNRNFSSHENSLIVLRRAFTTIRNEDAQRFKYLNHFPGSAWLGNKMAMYHMIQKAAHKLPALASSTPLTFCLPYEWPRVTTLIRQGALRGQWLLKPAAGSCGRGIRGLNVNEITGALATVMMGGEPKRQWVLQQYVPSATIGRRKFDLRLYVAVLSISPLILYMNDNGLVRFASVEDGGEGFEGSIEFNAHMHLTNFSVRAPQGVQPINTEFYGDGMGRKWSKRQLDLFLKEKGFDQGRVDVNRLWEEVGDIVCQTVIASLPKLTEIKEAIAGKHGRESPSFFELLGFDILIDSSLKPRLIEVNLSPSLSSTSDMDFTIKHEAASQMLDMLNIPTSARSAPRVWRFGDEWDERGLQHVEESHSHRGSYRLLFPTPGRLNRFGASLNAPNVYDALAHLRPEPLTLPAPETHYDNDALTTDKHCSSNV